MRSALAWRRFYAAERDALGPAGLAALFDDAPALPFPARGALVFPHTNLRATGAMVAAVARAVVDSGADRVLALGVLHGARERDAERVSAARAGNAAALAELRRVHDDAGDGHAAEEFSLDGFAALLALAAERAGRRAPTLVARYPCLVGHEPAKLPGIDALRVLLADGCALVATTDPIHHGAGYGTPEGARQDERDASTVAHARAAVDAQLAALAAGDYAHFVLQAAAHRSDFRDVGPVLAELLHGRHALRFTVRDLALVDYSDALACERPTWVAGALIEAA